MIDDEIPKPDLIPRELPWSRECFVCGSENALGLQLRARVEGDLVVLDHVTGAGHQGWQGILHGGVTTALADEVMTWAAILACRRACVSAEISVRMLRQIGLGVRLRVEGLAEPGARRRLVRTSARILDEDGVPLATATGKYMPPPGQRLDLDSAGFTFEPSTQWVADLLR